jgi:hypothetical protein
VQFHIHYNTLSIFITVTYCNYCTKQYSVLLLAIFVNVLIFVIFKLNCVLGMGGLG